MADESSKNLLETLTGSRLPALPDTGAEREPTEAPERTEVIETGRKPEDVVQAREERQPTETQEPEVGIPAAPKKKGKAEAKTYEIDGKHYTLAELEASGLLEKQIQTARQFPSLQKKYVETLEASRNGAPATQQAEQQPQAPAEITNLMIAQTYDPVADIILKDLVDKKLLEEDLLEAYPRSLRTLTGQSRFSFDKIFELEAKVNQAIARLEATITYLNANKAQTEGQGIANKYNAHLDGLVAKDGKLYGGLKNQNIRDAFTKYLVEELNATSEQCTDDKKAPGFLAKQWVAFNSSAIMDAAKDGVKDRQQRQDKRFVTGEGSGSRPGMPAEEPDMLNRMIDRSGRIRE